MPHLVLGPLLRYVSETEATVWVETDAPCEVEVLGHRARTFQVEGHHYALIVIRDLEPGSTTPYDVLLDRERRWPDPGADLPPSVIRTPRAGEPLELLFGSCRVTLPHEPPWTLSRDDDERGREHDALRAFALELARNPLADPPKRLLMLGDQVYVDEGSPAVRERIAATRATDAPPGRQVASFEEYTWLYREAWGEPVLRWLLSTVPSAMVWDDHDMHDDWNISESWVREMRAHPWWRERVRGGIASYWVYQHLGNLSPAELDRSELYARAREADDAGRLLCEFADRADRENEGTRWSYCRDAGGVRVVVIDSRAGRVLGDSRHEHRHEHGRAMVDDHEWDWIEEHATGGVDHLVLATSLPFLLPHGLHWLEAWNEALCDGAWGRPGRALGERARRAADLEAWASFQDSWHRLAALITDVASGGRGAAPATVTVVSGDVHFAYLAEARPPQAESRCWQAVCSPFRNALGRSDREILRFAGSAPGRGISRGLARLAGVERPELSWRVRAGPWFDNQLARIAFDGRDATLALDSTCGGSERLERLGTWRLSWPG